MGRDEKSLKNTVLDYKQIKDNGKLNEETRFDKRHCADFSALNKCRKYYKSIEFLPPRRLSQYSVAVLDKMIITTTAYYTQYQSAKVDVLTEF